jgi:hypothetical protein
VSKEDQWGGAGGLWSAYGRDGAMAVGDACWCKEGRRLMGAREVSEWRDGPDM